MDIGFLFLRFKIDVVHRAGYPARRAFAVFVEETGIGGEFAVKHLRGHMFAQKIAVKLLAGAAERGHQIVKQVCHSSSSGRAAHS